MTVSKSMHTGNDVAAQKPKKSKKDEKYLIELMAELHKLDSLIALNANCRRLSSLSICQDASDCSQKSLECPNLAITHARDILYREILAVEKRLSEKIRTRNVSKRSVS